MLIVVISLQDPGKPSPQDDNMDEESSGAAAGGAYHAGSSSAQAGKQQQKKPSKKCKCSGAHAFCVRVMVAVARIVLTCRVGTLPCRALLCSCVRRDGRGLRRVHPVHGRRCDGLRHVLRAVRRLRPRLRCSIRKPVNHHLCRCRLLICHALPFVQPEPEHLSVPSGCC